MSTPDTVDESILRRLAQLRFEHAPVLSVYLNLDPERFATAPARASAITSVLDEAHRQVEETARPHEEHMALRADLERVGEHLRSATFDGASGLAVFSSMENDLFESLRLAHPVENAVVVDAAPFIAPLADMGAPAARWCVAVVNRRSTRVLRGDADSLVEVSAFGDDVHGQHSQGGWSQARYERSVERDVDEHLRRSADLLLTYYRRRPFDGLVLVTPRELQGRVADSLHAYLRERLRASIGLDLEKASVEEVRERAAEEIRKVEQARLREQLERLHAALGSGGRAAAGPDDVLRALGEQRVEVLLYRPGADMPGALCRRCGFMTSGAAQGQPCPVDGGEMERRASVLEAAIEAAIAQSAERVPVEGPELGPIGEIAALLRF